MGDFSRSLIIDKATFVLFLKFQRWLCNSLKTDNDDLGTIILGTTITQKMQLTDFDVLEKRVLNSC